MSKPGAPRGRLSLRFRSDGFTCIKLAFSKRYVRFHDSCKKKQTFSLRPQTIIRHRLFEAFNQRVLGNNFLFPEEGYITGDGSNAPQAVMIRMNDSLVQDLSRARQLIDTQLRERFVRGSRQFDEEILHTKALGTRARQ
jgi:hypothetical protein